MSNQTSREISIFLAAIETKGTEELRAYLNDACGDDRQLRTDVEALLVAHLKDNSFLEHPAIAQTIELNQHALDAGLAATFGPNAAVVIGKANHSVLKSLSKRLSNNPTILLRENGEAESRVVQLGSKEFSTKQSDSRYQLHGEIARGGMGAIIKGRDTDLGRDLAIKVLLDEHKDKPEMLQRFVEEAQIGGQLQHPGIVPVYELGLFNDERPFFSMKLVKGDTLAELLARRKNPQENLPKLLGIFEQVCQAMAYAHNKGVVHRDLKPANIMIGAFGEVQVMDWGLSKVLSKGGVADERKSLDKQRNVSVIQTRRSVGSDVPGEVGSNTQLGSVMGTPAYMPPEQALGEIDRLDERADVFGLGAILAEILSGKPPYVADDTTQVYRMASRGKLDECFVRLDASGADGELIELAKKALAPEPEDRIRNASEVSQSITEYLENVQIRLRDSEIATARAQTKKRLSFAIAGLMLLLATFGIIAATSSRQQSLANQQLAKRAKEAESNANQALEDALAAEGQARKAERQASIEKKQAMKAEERAHKESLRAGMSAAEAIRSQDPTVSLLLAIDAVKSFQSNTIQIPIPHIAYETLLSITTGLGLNVSKHSSSILDISFSKDGRWFASTDGDAVRLCDMMVDNPFGSEKQLDVNGFKITAIEFSPNSRWLVGASENGSLLLWQMTSGTVTPNILMPANEGRINSFAFSADSSKLVTSCMNGTARVWELEAKIPIASTIALDSNGGVQLTFATFGPRDTWVLTGDEIGQIHSLDFKELNAQQLDYRVPEQTKGVGKAIRHIFIRPDGKQFITNLGDFVHIWNVHDRTHPLHILWGPYHDIRTCDVSPNCRWLVTGGTEKTARLWDLESTDPMSNYIELSGHEKHVNAVEINRHLVVTGSADETARVWKINSPTEDPITLRGHSGEISSVAISPSGNWVATAGVDNTVRLWKLDLDLLLRNGRELAGRELTPLERKRLKLNPKQLEGFQPHPVESLTALFDGATLKGWKVEGEGDWRVEDGTIVGQGGRLVFMDETFDNLEVSVECSVNKGGNSGLHVRTQYVEDPNSWQIGYEAQVTNMTGQETLTGGIYGITEYYQPLIADDEWFTLTFRAVNNELVVFVNTVPTTQTVDNERKFANGHISLQSRPETTARFRNIRARRL